jgi:hypothetical protein
MMNFDRSLPPWEAQSLCVYVGPGGPRAHGHDLYPKIVKIKESLDWDALAATLK